MTREEKAQWLSDFYRQVADGGVSQFYRGVRGWKDVDAGPYMDSDMENWRIKPEPREWEGVVYQPAAEYQNNDGAFIAFSDPDVPKNGTRVKVIEVLDE